MSSLLNRTPAEIMMAAVRYAERVILEKTHVLELENLKKQPDAETVTILEDIISRQQSFVDRTKAKPGVDWSTYVGPPLGDAIAPQVGRMHIGSAVHREKAKQRIKKRMELKRSKNSENTEKESDKGKEVKMDDDDDEDENENEDEDEEMDDDDAEKDGEGIEKEDQDIEKGDEDDTKVA